MTAALGEGGITLLGVERVDPSLEDIFIHLVASEGAGIGDRV